MRCLIRAWVKFHVSAFLIALVTAAVPAAGQPASANSAAFTIAVGGRARAAIVLPEKASAVERFVGKELAEYLARITTARFEILGDAAAMPAGLNLIHVGRSRFAAENRISAGELEKEGFRIKTLGRHLFLLGKDDSGTQFAVYEFLEKYCGVRWFWPGEFGEEVPRTETLRLKPIDERQAPFFKRRTMYLAWGKGDAPIELDYERFGRKWKVGASVKTVGVHTWGQIAPPATYGPTHPEYFALVNGTRQRDWSKFDGSHEYQLCTSNPEVVRLSIEWARRYFDEHPDADILSISPNDGLGFCECERCRALDSGETLQIHGKSHPQLADRIITYANAVAEGVAAAHVDKQLVILAYTVYREPPKRIKPHKNLVIQYADNAEFHWDEARKKERLAGLEAWARLSSNLMIYEYYAWGGHHPGRGLTPVISESIKRFQRLNIRYFRSQSRADYGLNGLNYYLAAKLLWNPSLETDAVLGDYFEKCFGRAALPMREYFRLLDERWKAAVTQFDTSDLTPQTALYYMVAYDPSARARLRALLDQAAGIAGTERHKARVEFYSLAFRYAELTVQAAERMVELDRKGVVTVEKTFPTRVTAFKKPSEWTAGEQAGAERLLAETIAAWEARQKFMDAIEGRYILDDRFARVCDTYYHFNPLEKLREIQALYAAP